MSGKQTLYGNIHISLHIVIHFLPLPSYGLKSFWTLPEVLSVETGCNKISSVPFCQGHSWSGEPHFHKLQIPEPPGKTYVQSQRTGCGIDQSQLAAGANTNIQIHKQNNLVCVWNNMTGLKVPTRENNSFCAYNIYQSLKVGNNKINMKLSQSSRRSSIMPQRYTKNNKLINY